jgi:hypothetical protein
MAGCLKGFQLAEAAIDGALDRAFVAGKLGEGVETGGEGAVEAPLAGGDA